MSGLTKEEEINEYLEQVKIFEETTPEKAEALLEAKEGHTIYIGRETCSYSRRFVRKLSKLAEEEQLTVHYIHSKNPDFTDEIKAFRDKYDVPTVPGLLYSSDSSGIVVKCDSSLEPEEIKEILEINK